MLYQLRTPWNDVERAHHEQAWAPAVDIEKTEQGHVLRLDVPGIPVEAISIEAEQQSLSIKGERQTSEEENGHFSRRERASGTFARRFQLPDNADTSKIDAKLEHGVLTLHIPNKAESQPRKIEIQTH